MAEETWKGLSKYLLIALFLGLVYAAFLVLKPFFTVFVVALITTYLFLPLYNLVKKVLRSPRLASLVSCSIILVLAVLVLAILMSAVTFEAIGVYGTLSSQGFDEELKQKFTDAYSFLSKYSEKTPTYARLFESGKESAGQYASKAGELALAGTIGLAKAFGKIILGIALTVLMVFYFFKDGPTIVKKIKESSPLPKKHTDYVIDQLDKTLHTLAYSIVFVALGMGGLSLIGFLLFGIKPAFFLGILTTFAAFIPAGSALVWVPVIIYHLATVGITSTAGLVKTVLLALYALIVVGSTDNIIRFMIASRSVPIHPILIITGIIGGVIVFGLSGFIVGPVVLVLVTSLISSAYQKPDNGETVALFSSKKIKGWLKKIF